MRDPSGGCRRERKGESGFGRQALSAAASPPLSSRAETPVERMAPALRPAPAGAGRPRWRSRRPRARPAARALVGLRRKSPLRLP